MDVNQENKNYIKLVNVLQGVQVFFFFLCLWSYFCFNIDKHVLLID